jgi:hypothetical protein
MAASMDQKAPAIESMRWVGVDVHAKASLRGDVQVDDAYFDRTVRLKVETSRARHTLAFDLLRASL